MKSPLLTIVILASLSLLSCSRTNAPQSLEGAWLGEGFFSTRGGDQAVKAQLELLSNGTYRYLILEPRILMLTGIESGKWTRAGQQLTLQPVNEKSETKDDKTSVFAKLRKSSPENLRVKQLTIADDLSGLELADGPMTLQFQPNAKATKKLNEAGEVK